MREGLARARARASIAAEAILSLCANPARPNAREAASTAVKRLVASLDAEAKAEVKAVEEDAEAGPPRRRRTRGIRRRRRASSGTRENAPSSRASLRRHASRANETAKTSRTRTRTSSRRRLRPRWALSRPRTAEAPGTKKTKTKTSPRRRSPVLAPRARRRARYGGDVHCGGGRPGVWGCSRGEDGASCGDPVACLTKRFAAVGGPFKLPGVQIPRIDRTASTARHAAGGGPSVARRGRRG